MQRTECDQCGAPSRLKYCSQQCKDASKRVPCAGCEKPIYLGRGSRPAGVARCRACRKEEPRPAGVTIARTCSRCGVAFEVKRVSDPKRYCNVQCANASTAAPVRSPTDRRTTRRAREQSAPGLSQSARKALRDRWRTQGRQCVYCTSPATTIDHVLPLVRGGTNHEGNLAPCCKSCNSSKAGWTVIEWRTGRRLKPMDGALPWDHARGWPRQSRRPPAGQQLALVICDICGCLGTGKTCSYTCQRVRARNAYRLRAGIPLDAPLTGNGRPRTRAA